MRISPPTSSDLPLNAAVDGVRLAVRLTPRAGAERIEGVAGGRLKVWVTAPPHENRANDALLGLLAKEWRLPRRDLSIAGGAKNRDKLVHVTGEPGALMARLTMLIAEYPA